MTRAALFVVMLALSASALAVDRKPITDVDVDRLVAGTQAVAPAGDDHMNLVWWIPVEFWKATFAGDPSMSDEQKKAVLDTMEGVVLLGVCQADISPFGAFDFYGKDEVGKALAITYMSAGGDTCALPPVERVDDDLRGLLDVFGPILAAAMGDMGANFHFFVLSDRDGAGARLVDPYGAGVLRVGLESRDGARLETEVELPLDALHVPRTCPNGREAHVSWKFCPWTGEKLPE